MSSDKLRIDTDKLDEISQQFDRLSNSLNSIDTSIAQVISSARFIIPEQPSIIRNITTLKGRVNSSSAYARKVSGAVRNAAARWAEAEGRVVSRSADAGDSDDSGGDAGGGSGSGDKAGKTLGDYLLSGLFKVIGGACPAGKVISALWNGITKGTFGDWIKSGADILGEGIKYVTKGSSAKWWERVLGLVKNTKTPGAMFWDKLGFKSNPVGWFVNGVKAAVDNWDLVENGNLIRFGTETFAEAGTNVLLGAGGAALATLILPAGAPVIAIGALGALAVWGVDSIVEALTGDTIAHHVGHAVGEATDWVVEKGGQAVDWLVENGGKAVNWVADKGQQLLDTGARVISDAKDAVCGFFSSVFA